MKRGYLLPPGCKNLGAPKTPPPTAPKTSSPNFVRINGKIRAREVRVIDERGEQLGILPLADALNLARSRGIDLVEISPNAKPPVCRLVDYGRFRYEEAKKQKKKP